MGIQAQYNPNYALSEELGSDIGGAITGGFKSYNDTLDAKHHAIIAAALTAYNGGDRDGALKLINEGRRLTDDRYHLGLGDLTPPQLAQAPAQQAPAPGPLAGYAPKDPMNGQPGLTGGAGLASGYGVATTPPGALASYSPADTAGLAAPLASPGTGLSANPAGPGGLAAGSQSPAAPAGTDWSDPRADRMVRGELGIVPQFETVPFGGSVIDKRTGLPVYQDQSRANIAKDGNAAKMDREKLALAARASIATATRGAAWDRLVTGLHSREYIASVSKDPASHIRNLATAAHALAGPPDPTDLDGSQYQAKVQAIMDKLAAEAQLPGAGGSPTGQAPFGSGVTGGGPSAPTFSTDIDALVSKAAQANGIPEPIFRRLVAAESNGNPHARSPVGAMGLTQLMPGTAKDLGVTDPYDAEQNLMGGAKYFAQQYQRFGSWDKAAAAYNAGPGAVEKYGGVPPYAETQAYVAKVSPPPSKPAPKATPKPVAAHPVTKQLAQKYGLDLNAGAGGEDEY